MSFSLIQQIQSRKAVVEQPAIVVQPALVVESNLPADIADIVNRVMSEAFDQSQFEISPQDYSRWLEVIVDVANDDGQSINTKRNFMQIALDYVLDNDPKIESLGGDAEALKGQIADTLWQTYKASKAHKAVASGVGDTIRQAREEEEERAQVGANLPFTRGQGAKVKIDGRWLPGMVIHQEANGTYTVRVKMNNSTEDIPHISVDDMRHEENEESGFEQALRVSTGTEEEEECPYPANSLRAALWHDVSSRRHVSSKIVTRVKGVQDEEEIIDDEIDLDGDDIDVTDDTIRVGDVGDESVEDLADRIVDDTPTEDDSIVVARVDDLADRVADLEKAVDTKQEDDDKILDIDYDKLGTDRGGAHQVIGVSVPATGREDEETATRDMFRKAITAPRDMMTQAVKDVEDEGRSAWTGLSVPKNPHPKKSQAYKAWERGLKNAAKDALGIKDKPVVPSKQIHRKK